MLLDSKVSGDHATLQSSYVRSLHSAQGFSLHVVSELGKACLRHPS